MKLILFFKKNIFLLIIIALVIGFNLPFLDLGFGSDADAWRIARVGQQFLKTGEYSASRLPGYPLYEIAVSPFVALGPLYSNLLALISFIGSIIIFAKILPLYDVKNKKILIILFSFFPILIKSAGVTMDYTLALSLVLLSYYFLQKQKYIWSSIFLGAAVGARITSGIFIIAFLYYLWTKNKNYIWKYLFLFATSSILFFAPVIATYGPFGFLKPAAPASFWNTPNYDTFKQLYQGVIATSIASMGLLASLTLIILLISKYKIIIRLLKTKNLIFFILILVPSLGILFIAPGEPEYLVSFFPFLFLFLDKVFNQKKLIVFTAVALTFSCIQINKIILDNKKLDISVSQGILLRDYKMRQDKHLLAKNICQVFPSKEKAQVIIGSNAPQIALYNYNTNKCKKKEVFFQYLSTQERLIDFIDQGYKIYYLEGLDATTQRVYKYDLKKFPTHKLKYKDIIYYKK